MPTDLSISSAIDLLLAMPIGLYIGSAVGDSDGSLYIGSVLFAHERLRLPVHELGLGEPWPDNVAVSLALKSNAIIMSSMQPMSLTCLL